jgi:hypothetical protein
MIRLNWDNAVFLAHFGYRTANIVDTMAIMDVGEDEADDLERQIYRVLDRLSPGFRKDNHVCIVFRFGLITLGFKLSDNTVRIGTVTKLVFDTGLQRPIDTSWSDPREPIMR